MLEQIASQAFTLLAGRTQGLKSGRPLDALESFKVAINVYGMALQTPCFMAVLDWRSAGTSVRLGYSHLRYNN